MSFDGHNIIQKNLHSILQCENALEKVELFDCAGYRNIGATLFVFVRAKKGNGNQRFFGEMFEKPLKFYIESSCISSLSRIFSFVRRAVSKMAES